jgi:hypothetical protein
MFEELGFDIWQRQRILLYGIHIGEIKLPSCLINEDVLGSAGIAPPLLTSALDAGECSASLSGRFTTGERSPGTHFVASWVGLRTGLVSVPLASVRN